MSKRGDNKYITGNFYLRWRATVNRSTSYIIQDNLRVTIVSMHSYAFEHSMSKCVSESSSWIFDDSSLSNFCFRWMCKFATIEHIRERSRSGRSHNRKHCLRPFPLCLLCNAASNFSSREVRILVYPTLPYTTLHYTVLIQCTYAQQ